MDMMECKMRCAYDEGSLLWPMPKQVQLSEELNYCVGEFGEIFSVSTFLEKLRISCLQK